MSKDKPLIFWGAFGVLSVIALALLGWSAAGISDFSTVKADQRALTARVDNVEKKQATVDLMATDVAVIKVELRALRRELKEGE